MKKNEFIIPKKLTILNDEWKISIKDKMDKGLLGTSNNTTREIQLLKVDNSAVQIDTFFHEATHSILTSCCDRKINIESTVVPLSKGIRDFTGQMIDLHLKENKTKEVKKNDKRRNSSRASSRK